jgi:hypothetical protein
MVGVLVIGLPIKSYASMVRGGGVCATVVKFTQKITEEIMKSIFFMMSGLTNLLPS